MASINRGIETDQLARYLPMFKPLCPTAMHRADKGQPRPLITHWLCVVPTSADSWLSLQLACQWQPNLKTC
jgi:hypothetical protein